MCIAQPGYGGISYYQFYCVQWGFWLVLWGKIRKLISIDGNFANLCSIYRVGNANLFLSLQALSGIVHWDLMIPSMNWVDHMGIDLVTSWFHKNWLATQESTLWELRIDLVALNLQWPRRHRTEGHSRLHISHSIVQRDCTLVIRIPNHRRISNDIMF